MALPHKTKFPDAPKQPSGFLKAENSARMKKRARNQDQVAKFEQAIADGLLKKDPEDPYRKAGDDVVQRSQLTDDPDQAGVDMETGMPERVPSEFKESMVLGAGLMDEDSFWPAFQDALEGHPYVTGDPRNVLVDQYWDQNVGFAPHDYGKGHKVYAGNEAFVLNTHMVDEGLYGKDAANQILTNHAKRNANILGDMNRGQPENLHRDGSPSNNLTDKWIYHPYRRDIGALGTADALDRVVEGSVDALPHESGHMATLRGTLENSPRSSDASRLKFMSTNPKKGLWLNSDNIGSGRDAVDVFSDLNNTAKGYGHYFNIFPEAATVAREAKFNRIYGKNGTAGSAHLRDNTLRGDNKVLDEIIYRPKVGNENEEAISVIFKNMDEKGQEDFRRMWYRLGSNDVKGSLMEEGNDVMA